MKKLSHGPSVCSAALFTMLISASALLSNHVGLRLMFGFWLWLLNTDHEFDLCLSKRLIESLTFVLSLQNLQIRTLIHFRWKFLCGFNVAPHMLPIYMIKNLESPPPMSMPSSTQKQTLQYHVFFPQNSSLFISYLCVPHQRNLSLHRSSVRKLCSTNLALQNYLSISTMISHIPCQQHLPEDSTSQIMSVPSLSQTNNLPHHVPLSQNSYTATPRLLLWRGERGQETGFFNAHVQRVVSIFIR